MITVTHALICAGLALALYGVIGLPLAQRVVMRSLAPWLAPALGWVVHSALALPLCFALGLTRVTAIAIFAVPLMIAAAALWRQRDGQAGERAPLPGWLIAAVLAGAALIAFDFMAVDLPKVSAQGLTLAAPIFDHSKIAMIDEMARLGVPPGNPFYGGEGPARLSYYYLWHFSAAELSLLTGLSGWASDAGLSFFTGFAAILAMAGLAIWLSGRASAALWIVLLSLTASARPVLEILFGQDQVEQVAGYQSGLGGFLFQTSWAPQHAMAAVTAVIALVVLAAAIERPRWPVTLVFALLMTAAFQSSTWIGGIAFPLMAAPAALLLLWRAAPGARLRVVIHLAAAALLALALIAPFLYDQSHMAALRNEGTPVAIAPVSVLHELERFGALANLAAYWLIYLPVEFPAIYLAGIAGLVMLLRERNLPLGHRDVTIAFASGIAMSLLCGWLLVSTLGENNDLGWRAVLPAVLLLMIAAAVALTRLRARPTVLAAALFLIAVSLVDGLRFGYGNIVVRANAATPGFAASEKLWAAVRRVTPPGERIANDPDYLAKATPWPVNMSWALLADRRSCFAGRDLVRPFSSLSQVEVDATEALFKRVFAGNPEAGDVEQLANRLNCDTAVVVPSDGAWMRDPFAASARYQMVEETPAWRIYRRVAP